MINALLNAENLANQRYNAAVRAVNLTGVLANYEWTYERAGSTFASNVANAFGNWQRTTRQGMASGVLSTDPLYGLYSSETAWATQTNRLRQQFYASEFFEFTGKYYVWDVGSGVVMFYQLKR